MSGNPKSQIVVLEGESSTTTHPKGGGKILTGPRKKTVKP